MKSFNCSAIGKALNFIVINICVIIFAAAFFGLYAASEYDIFTTPEEEILNQITGRNIRSDLLDIICTNIFEEANTEFDGYSYQIFNNSGNVIGQSREKVARCDYIGYYDVITQGEYASEITELENSSEKVSGELITVIADVNDHASQNPEYKYLKAFLDLIYMFKDWLIVILFVSFFIAVISFVLLMSAAGRNGKTDEVVLNFIDRIPLDVLTVLVCAIDCIILVVLKETVNELNLFSVVSFVFAYLIWFNTFLEFLVTCAVRLKGHTLIRNTICFKILHFFYAIIKRIFGSLPHVWVVLIVLEVFFVLQIIAMIASFSEEDGTGFIIFTLFFDFVFFLLIMYIASMLTKLQEVGNNIAAGKYNIRVNTSGLFGALKRHAQNLNSISEGVSLAVDKELKSERMKTELITNVSHDLKTPLTSIINYADLIANEPCENENITEYAQILVKQSDKLKRLIEDLVEASKASTGNLEVSMSPCDPSIFISQAAGEYEEKLAASNLSLVTKISDEEITIMADPRRMWRIFDNLMNNICKYSLPGSRVYLNLEVMGTRAVMTFKNTSKEALDITEDELMERFVRGDSSRNTEGNGLGLSIAKSLAELQNGVLGISIDGDLFKAVLSFPVVGK